MRFKLDENLPREVASEFESKGHDATTVVSQAMGGAPDAEIAEVLSREKRILVFCPNPLRCYLEARNLPIQECAMAISPDIEEGKFTVEDYMNLDDDRRYELIEGELRLTPAPASIHQHFITLFGAEIALHVHRNDLGRTYDTPFDVVLADDTVVQPDLTYVRSERVDEVIDERGAVGAPDLVVEVLSPSTERRDRIKKRRIYAEKGVEWLLFAHPPSRIVEVLRLQPESGKYLIEETFGPNDTFHVELFDDLRIELVETWPPEEEE